MSMMSIEVNFGLLLMVSCYSCNIEKTIQSCVLFGQMLVSFCVNNKTR